MLKFLIHLYSFLIEILIKWEVYIKNVKISYIIILKEQVGWKLNPDLCINTIPKQLNFESDPNIDKKGKIRGKMLTNHIQVYIFLTKILIKREI